MQIEIKWKYTFSCFTSFNCLGDTLQLMIDQVGATELNEYETEDQVLIPNGVEHCNVPIVSDFNDENYNETMPLQKSLEKNSN